MSSEIRILGRKIGPGQPCYVIAEMSGNHNQSFEQAVKIIHAAKECGADAVKLQTYTPDTITIQCDRPEFRVGGGTLWDGKTLYDLYGEAYTPWDWQPKLKAEADRIGIGLFSTPFDFSAIELLEKMDVPAYKVASFEIVDFGLIERIAKTGKPMIMSTGMCTESEVEDAVRVARNAGACEIVLLKCTSQYPAPPEHMNLRTIPWMQERFGLPVGLSDHTLGIAAPIAAVALGACVIEKHFTLSRAEKGPDSAFSLEPAEFKDMVDAVRVAEKALGRPELGNNPEENKSRIFRRSLYVVKDVLAGEKFTSENVRSIRPGYGLHTRHLSTILGRVAATDIPRGTPMSWEIVQGSPPKSENK